MLALVRCDDRLIHGQCMTVIVKEHDIQEIIVVDDFTANNSVLKSVFKTAVPSSMKADVFTVEDAIEKINEAKENTVRVLLLMKTPNVFKKLLELMPDLPKELNIGPMTKRKGSVSVHPSISIIAEEAEAIKAIVSQGVHVYFQQVGSQPAIEWDEVKDKF